MTTSPVLVYPTDNPHTVRYRLKLKKYLGKEQKTLEKFLQIKHPDVFCKKKELDNPQWNPVGQNIGDQMSGKTDAQIAQHHYLTVCRGEASYHLVPDSGDIPQFALSVKNYNKDWRAFGLSCSIEVQPLELLYASSLKLNEYGRVEDPDDLATNMRKGKNPAKLTVCLAHQDQLYRLARLIYRTYAKDPSRFRPYNVTFDESHITMFPNEAEVRLEDVALPEDVDNWPVSLTKYESVSTLLTYATRALGTSATATINLFDEKFPVAFIVKIRPRANYRNILSLKYDRIEPLAKDTAPEDDPELHRIISEWAAAPPLDKDQYSLKMDHPVFGLVQVSVYTATHQKIADHAEARHPDKFVLILHNDKGLEIRFPTHIADYINTKMDGMVSIENEGKYYSAVVSEMNRVVLSTSTPLHAALQFVSNLGEMVTHMMMIAGNKVKQGRRVNSSDYRLALTNLFLRDESAMDVALQKNRAVGYRYDGRYIVVHCDGRLHSDMITAYKLNQELNEKMEVELAAKSLRRRFAHEILATLTISRVKVAKKPMCKTPMPMTKVRAEEDDFTETAQDYVDDVVRTEAKESMERRARLVEAAKVADLVSIRNRAAGGEVVTLIPKPDRGVKASRYRAITDYLGTQGGWVKISEIIDLLLPDGARRDPTRGRIQELIATGEEKSASRSGLQCKKIGRSWHFRCVA